MQTNGEKNYVSLTIRKAYILCLIISVDKSISIRLCFGDVDKRQEFYRGVKIIGFASFIPFVLFTGPLVGYFISLYIRKKFNMGWNITLILTLIGLAAGLYETICIIKAMIRAEKKS